jgi:protein-tyrosine phosphatase
MIDIHCHMLPNVDDGPDSMDESLALAQFAVDRGITHSVLTPHIHPGRWDNEALSIRAVWIISKKPWRINLSR